MKMQIPFDNKLMQWDKNKQQEEPQRWISNTFQERNYSRRKNKCGVTCRWKKGQEIVSFVGQGLLMLGFALGEPKRQLFGIGETRTQLSSFS